MEKSDPNDLSAKYPDAMNVAVTVSGTIFAVAAIAEARVKNPEACPSVPDDFVGHMTRKLLGNLAELGLSPKGWELAYMSDWTKGK